MILGRVTGHVVSTAKHGTLSGKKLLIVTPEETDSTTRTVPEILAVDAVGAGIGERVLVVVEGRSAGVAAGIAGAPLDATIVGIVDRIDAP